VDFVAFEVFAEAVGAGHEVVDVGGFFQGEKPKSLIPGDFAAVKDATGQLRNTVRRICVNQSSTHG
jgi:hypothetical protein